MIKIECKPNELCRLAQEVCGDKMSYLNQCIAELTGLCNEQKGIIDKLEQAVIVKDDIIKKHQEQLIEFTRKMGDATVTTWALNNFLVLSQQKVQEYLNSIDNATRAVIGLFMFQSLPDNAPAIMIDYIKKVTQPEAVSSTVVVNHADVAVGVAENGSQVFHHQSEQQ